MYGEAASTTVDPYSDAYNAPAAATPDDRDPAPARGRSRSRSPVRREANGGGANGESRYRSPPPRRRSPPPRRSAHAPMAPNPTNVLGVFGLSIRTQERDLDEEFGRYGRVDKVTIVYDQRSDRSRGFGFIKMAAVEDATKCIQALNGVELNGRKIRVDYSVTDRPHAPTPGEYMGHRRSTRDSHYDRRDRDSHRDSYKDRDRRDRDRDRDGYGRDRDWRRTPPRRHSPERDYKRRRSYSRTPPPRVSSPPRSSARDYDAAPAAAAPGSSTEANRW